MSVVVRSTDGWSLEHAEAIDEPRLLDKVRATLGPQVRALRSAPWNPRDSDDPWTRTGVPVSPFPRWLRCPRCHRLAALDPPGQFDLVHRTGRRPDLAKWVHSTCQQQTQTRDQNKRACLPARFLAVCEAGHLDEFPYVDFVHRGQEQPCAGPKLTMRDSSSTLGPRVTVRCFECSASRNIYEFTLPDARRVGLPEEDWDDEPVLDAARLRIARSVALDSAFRYVFDLGDYWVHRCTVGPRKVDPLDALGIVPDRPLPCFGWGSIPDQYGRRWDGDDGEAREPPRPSDSDRWSPSPGRRWSPRVCPACAARTSLSCVVPGLARTVMR